MVMDRMDRMDRGDRGDRGERGDRRRGFSRGKPQIRYQMPKDSVINYKNVALLQKYVNDRGKIVPRRLSGISAKQQRQLTAAVKQARFLALLPTGGFRK